MRTKRIRNFVLLLAVLQLTSLVVVTPEVSAQSRSSGQATFWTDFLRWFRPRKPLRGRRGDGMCMVSPLWLGQEQRAKIWNTRPLFVWNGRTTNIGVSTEGHNGFLWSKPLRVDRIGNQQLKAAQYAGDTAIQPGQIYRWHLLTIKNESVQQTAFQVIGGAERDRVSAGLKALQAQLEAGKLSAEEQAIRRAEFFAQHDLGSDAIQELLSVKNPSPELQDLAKKMATEICTE